MNRIEIALLSAGLSLACLQLALLPRYTVDDAYILFRYADNLANYHQLTWNVGEPPVEGYTGVMLPVLLALFIKVGVSPEFGSKLIGIVSFLGGGLLLLFLLRKLSTRPEVRGAVVLYYYAAPMMAIHALGGLETVLFSTAVIGSCLAFVRSVGFGRSEPAAIPVLFSCLLFTSLVRPEGVALSALMGIAICIVAAREGRLRRTLGLIAAFYVIPGLIYFAWRLDYYGQFFPNPYYVKSSRTYLAFDPNSLRELWTFCLSYLAIPLVACSVMLLQQRKRSLELAWQRIAAVGSAPLAPILAVTLLFCLILVFKYTRTSLVMNWSHRYYVPVFAALLIPLAILSDIGWTVFLESRNVKLFWYSLLCIALVCMALTQAGFLLYRFDKGSFFLANYSQLVKDACEPASQILKRHVPKSEWVACVPDAGAISYFSGLKTVDFGGLNDRVLARRDRMNPQDVADYFYSFNPAAAVMASADWTHVVNGWGGEEIMNDPRWKNYVLAKRFRTDAQLFNSYFQFVFLRKDLFRADHGETH